MQKIFFSFPDLSSRWFVCFSCAFAGFGSGESQKPADRGPDADTAHEPKPKRARGGERSTAGEPHDHAPALAQQAGENAERPATRAEHEPDARERRDDARPKGEAPREREGGSAGERHARGHAPGADERQARPRRGRRNDEARDAQERASTSDEEVSAPSVADHDTTAPGTDPRDDSPNERRGNHRELSERDPANAKNLFFLSRPLISLVCFCARMRVERQGRA